MEKKRRNMWLAVILLLATTLAVSGGLLRLSRPDPALNQRDLNYTADDTSGWSFETRDGPVEPVLDDSGYLAGIPSETNEPLAAARMMEDTGELNLLQFTYSCIGIQVFLDGRLLYTDFPNMDNRLDTFLENVNTEGTDRELLYVTLPDNCEGQELRVVTYGSLQNGYLHPALPVLTGRFSDAAILVTDAVPYAAAITTLALLALFLLMMFLLGVQEGQPEWGLLPLAAYFLLAAVPVVRSCFLSTAAGLSDTPLLHWIALAYVDFLMIFMAMEMEGWKRWLLLAGAAAHALLSLIWVVWGVPGIFKNVETNPVGLALLVLASVLAAPSRREKALFRCVLAALCVTVGVLFTAWAVNHFWGLDLLYPLSNPVASLLWGDPRAFYTILCIVIGVLSAVWVAVQCIREAMDRRSQGQVLRMNYQMTRQSYQAAEEKLRLTAAMRHEWKNQVAALHLLQQQGDLAGLGSCLDELDGKLDRLAPKSYSEHFAINTILQNAAARAETLGVDFCAAAPVPSELGIETGDLCSLLLNMLDNALYAASQVPDGNERELECMIGIRQGYLAIRCENTYAGPLSLDSNGQLQTTKADRSSHGFGLAQMQAIAEKYGSILSIHYTECRFIAQTALKIR